MRYLIHNIYGDCDHLRASCPAEVECVSRGWTADEEAALAERLSTAELAGISCLPCLLEWVPQVGKWVETRVADLPTPWEWKAIDAAHAANVAVALLPPDPPMPSPVSSPTLSPAAAPSGGGTLAPGVAPSLGGAVRR